MGRVAVVVTLLVSERQESESLAGHRNTTEGLVPNGTMTSAKTMISARRNLT